MCVAMYDILLPVIKFSTDVSKAPHVYLMEDGLDLWLATLHCSPSITPGLLDLFVNMPDLYGRLYLRLASIIQLITMQRRSEPLRVSPFVELYNQEKIILCDFRFTLDVGSETLRTCIKITEAYLLLGPTQFIEVNQFILSLDLSICTLIW